MNRNPRKSLINRLHYEFDKTLAKGPLSLGGWVALVSAAIVLLLSLIVFLFQLNPGMTDLPSVTWTLLLQALAPNPVPVADGPWGYLGMMLLITLVGIFMVSIFIGIITTSIDSRIQLLRKGRSLVLENNHTVILGWDEHIFTIISELAVANENQRRSCVVVMGEKDKVEMEDEIRARVGRTGRMNVVCRRGSPMDMVDLEIVSLDTAKSIIVLAPDGDHSDTCVIKTLLAIVNNPKRRAAPYHIVTEIHDQANLEVVRLIGKDEVVVLLVSDIIAHITAQTCRQSGLSVVYTELLNFSGDEIYFQEEPALTGRTFGEALTMYADSAVIGIDPAGINTPSKLNPPMNTIIRAGDRIIAVSADDDTVLLAGLKSIPIQEDLICLDKPKGAKPEATLILGWNQRGATIIHELDNYVAPGSQVTVAANRADVESEVLAVRKGLKNQALSFQVGNTSERLMLESLNPAQYKHVIVLADLDGLTPEIADARTLVTLLQLRDIDEKAGHPFSIVSEMLDVRNRQLAEVTHVDDFIVSDELASLMLSQISENKELSLVFSDLFYPQGSEIYLKPCGDYVRLDGPVNFYTVVEAARRHGEVALGYRRAAQANDQAHGYGVVVNPDKGVEVVFHEHDRVIVLAES